LHKSELTPLKRENIYPSQRAAGEKRGWKRWEARVVAEPGLRPAVPPAGGSQPSGAETQRGLGWQLGRREEPVTK